MAASRCSDIPVRRDDEAIEARVVRRKDKIAALRAQMQAMERRLAASPDGQVLLVDPNAP